MMRYPDCMQKKQHIGQGAGFVLCEILPVVVYKSFLIYISGISLQIKSSQSSRIYKIMLQT